MSAEDFAKELEEIRTVILQNSEAIVKALSELSEQDLAAAAVDFGGLSDPLGQLENWLVQQFTNLANYIVNNIVSPIQNFINSLASQLMSGINAIANSLSQIVLPSISDFVSSVINGLNSIGASVGQLSSAIQGAMQSIANALSGLSSVAQSIASAIASIPSAIQNALSQAAQYISQFATTAQSFFASLYSDIQSFANSVQSALASLGNTLSNIINNVYSWLQSLGAAIQNALASATSTIQSFLSSVAGAASSIGQSIISALSSIQSTLSNFLSSAWSAIQSAFGQLENWFAGIWSQLKTWAQDAFNALSNALSSAWSAIQSAFGQLGSWLSNIWSQLKSWAQDAFSALINAVHTVFDTLKQAGTDIYGAIKDVASAAAQLPKYIAEALQFLENLPTTIQKVLADTFSAPDWAKALAEALAYAFSVAFPGLSAIMAVLSDALQGIDVKKFTQSIASFFADPAKALYEQVLKPVGQAIFAGLETLWNWIQSGLAWLGGKLVDVAKMLYSAASSAFSALASFASSIANAIASAFSWLGSSIKEIFTNLVADALGAALKAAIEPLTLSPETIAECMVDQSKCDVKKVYLQLALTVPVLAAATFAPIALGRALSGVAKSLEDVEISLEPLGLGTKFKLKPGEIISEMGKSISEFGREAMRHAIAPMILTAVEPFRFIARGLWKMILEAQGLGDIPLELPALGEVLHVARAYDVRQMRDYVAQTLAYRGEPDWFIKRALMLAPVSAFGSAWTQAYEQLKQEVQNGYITVIDRFGNTRYIPVSLLYEHVTPAELVAFHLRDLFLPPNVPAAQQPVVAAQSFAKWAYVLGISPDVALFHYLHSYHLPTAQEVWRFVARGLAGQLWYEPPQDVRDFANSEASLLGAISPVTPTALNFSYSTLMWALAEYMKWQGRAHFAWIPGFTSDAWLIIDQLADLPHVEHLRWMLRFGIIEQMARRGVGPGTVLRDILLKTIDSAATSKIQVDATMYTQLALARGFHPYWVPFMAASEVMDIAQGAKTLLRTGWLELYRMYSADINALEKLMSGLFYTSIKISYFDLSSYQWKTAWINVPLYWLPHERKLYEVRGVFDRVYYMIRDYTRIIERAAAQYVISPAEYVSMLSEFMKALSDSYYVKAVAEVTGMDPHEIPPLSLDPAIAPILQSYIQSLQDIETVLRMRGYVRYFLYQIVYAMRTGYIQDARAAQLIDSLVSIMRETPQLTTLLIALNKTLRDIVVTRNFAERWQAELRAGVLTAQEAAAKLTELGLDSDVINSLVARYSPRRQLTLLEPVVIAEYVPDALKLYPQHLQLLRVVEWWQPYLVKYAEARRIVADARRVINMAFDLAYTTPLYSNAIDKITDVMQAIGYDSKRIELIKTALEFAVLREQFRESVPTVRGALADSIYFANWQDVLTKILGMRYVTQDAVNYYLSLAHARRIRPLVNTLLTQYLQLLYNTPVALAAWGAVEPWLTAAGYDQEQIQIIATRALMMVNRRAFVESVPTVREAIADSLYFPNWQDVLNQVFQLRWVEPGAQKYYTELARRRRLWRWMQGVVYAIIYAYYRGAIDDNQLSQALNSLKQYGLTDDEIQLIKMRAYYYRCGYLGIC